MNLFLLKMTGEHSLTQLHLDTALGQCQAYMLLNATLQSEQPDVTTLVINLCPNNCSNRGVCSDGNVKFNKSIPVECRQNQNNDKHNVLNIFYREL